MPHSHGVSSSRPRASLMPSGNAMPISSPGTEEKATAADVRTGVVAPRARRANGVTSPNATSDATSSASQPSLRRAKGGAAVMLASGSCRRRSRSSSANSTTDNP